MKVLIACEFSGTVRDAFAAQGHDAVSCDFKKSLTPGQHYQGDVRDILSDRFDLLIAFPPCTDFSYAGAQYFSEKIKSGQMAKSILFVQSLFDCSISRKCIENPRGLMWKFFGRPSQIIQPYHFGHPYRKYTGLWLRNLRPLMHTSIMAERQSWVNLYTPGLSRSDHRSLTFKGIASAMAAQWGNIT